MFTEKISCDFFVLESLEVLKLVGKRLPQDHCLWYPFTNQSRSIMFRIKRQCLRPNILAAIAKFSLKSDLDQNFTKVQLIFEPVIQVVAVYVVDRSHHRG